MRINQFIARSSSMSRRATDIAIAHHRVTVNGQPARVGQEIQANDTVILDGRLITPAVKSVTILLHKPVGYVVSRNGQGSPTVYDLLPKKYHRLKPIGRLDKDSSGLLLLTNDGELAHKLTHPSFKKEKTYQVELDKSLNNSDQTKIEKGIKLEDGISHLKIKPLSKTGRAWQVTMQEGRNRQIRRTFAALGYTLISLHRTQLGPYKLTNLPETKYR